MIRAALLVSVAFLLSPLAARAAGCDSDADCKTGRVCLAGRCTAKPQGCSKDSDCPGELVCEQGLCTAAGEGSAASRQRASQETAAPAPQQPPGLIQAPPAAAPARRPSSELELPPLVAAPGAVLAAPPVQALVGLRPAYTKESWPLSLTGRPLVLPAGLTELGAQLEKPLSTGTYDQLGLLLRGRYGVDERLTAGIDALAFCVTGGCGDALQALSFQAQYLYYSDAGVNVVPEVSLSFAPLSPFTAALTPGVELAWKLGPRLLLWVLPQLELGVIGRGDSPSADHLRLLVEPRYALSDVLTLVPRLGLDLPLEATGAWLLPASIGLHWTLMRSFDVGGELAFGTLLPNAGQGLFEIRTLRAFATIRL
jgi:hypothetical protein